MGKEDHDRAIRVEDVGGTALSRVVLIADRAVLLIDHVPYRRRRMLERRDATFGAVHEKSRARPWNGDKMTSVGDSEWAKAAVLDASFFDKGRLSIGDVERLAAGLAARGAELWIPEVVVLEFAVPAWEDLTSERQMHKRLRQAGLADSRPLSDLDSAQIADELVKTCADIPNVVVIGLTGESAMAGLRDQILAPVLAW